MVAFPGVSWKWFKISRLLWWKLKKDKRGEKLVQLFANMASCKNRQNNKKQEMNTYQLAVGIIWWLEPWCIVNVINMHLCLTLPCPLWLLFNQMLFHRNARATKTHVKLSGMKKRASTVSFPKAGAYKLPKSKSSSEIKSKKTKTSRVSGHFMLMRTARWWTMDQHMWAKVGEDKGLCGNGDATVESSLAPYHNYVIPFFNQIF